MKILFVIMLQGLMQMCLKQADLWCNHDDNENAEVDMGIEGTPQSVFKSSYDVNNCVIDDKF